MENSLGTQARISGVMEGRLFLFVPSGGPLLDLQGASVDAPDTLTWHALFGAEYTFRRRWALLVDFRYIWSSRRVTIGFNGGEDLGISVPARTDFVDSPAANRFYGPVFIATGGLVDFSGRVAAFEGIACKGWTDTDRRGLVVTATGGITFAECNVLRPVTCCAPAQ